MRKKLLGALDDRLANLCTLFIVIITVWAVFTRYMLNSPILWVEEILLAAYIWAIMLGAAAAMKRRKHISIDVFFTMLPPKAQRYAQLMNDAISIVVLVVFGWLGLELAMESGGKITPILGVSYIYLNLAIPVGSFWMAIYLVIHMINDMRKQAEGENK
ncbi:MAG: siaT 2 [Proteobacteria bacterium]|nr:siaT 2 [Pseudomonadota bacterium]